MSLKMTSQIVARLIVATITCISANSQDKSVSIDEAGEAITAFVANAHRKVGFSGTVLAARAGKVVAAVAVGSTNGDHPNPIDTTTLFEIASSTKAFTAIAVMRLRDQGKLKLDDSIANHLPGVPENCRNITIRHLLQHTSGIPNTNMHGSGNELATVLPLFLRGGPKRPPGTHHQYWNQGYGLLSEIIARASGKSYVAFCKDDIFAVCGMKSSCFNGDKSPTNVLVATGMSAKGARSALDHPYGEYGFQYRGTGGLVTNVWDLWRWDRALAKGKFLPHESLAEMTQKPIGGYGLGWQIAATPNGKPFHHHNGSVRGFVADLRRYPSTDGCLMVLCNNDLYTPLDLVVTGCEQLLFDKPNSVGLPSRLEPKELAKLAGRFVDAKNRTLIVAADGQFARALIVWDAVRKSAGFLSRTEDGDLQFLFQNQPGLPVKVTTDEAGNITTLSLLKIDFKRSGQ